MVERLDNDEEKFADDPGDQQYQSQDVLLDRGVITTPYDAPVRTLLDEIREKMLVVNPPFQRKSVWKKDRQSKLIESLLLNIPVPVLYFAEDEDGTRVVVDGQQRLRAIEEFHSGLFKLQKLEMLSDLNGQRWTDLTPKQTRTILSRTLRCVVVSANSPPTLRFEMFERLNTGVTPLNDQELRNCIYRGRLNDFLDDLATSQQWLQFIGRSEPDQRMRHHELILRFFALNATLSDYRPPLKKILNDYMKENRAMEDADKVSFRNEFEGALSNVQRVFGDKSFRRVTRTEDDLLRWDTNLNRAVYDIQMLAFARLPSEEIVERADAILERFRALCVENFEFADAISRATADRTRFYARLRIWGEALVQEGITPLYLERLPRADVE